MASNTTPRSPQDREAETRKNIAALDSEGRWVSTFAGERLVGQPKFATSFRYISSDVFSNNIEALSDYQASSSK